MDRTGRRRRRQASDADIRLRAIADIIVPLARSLGANCEIVLHDYRIPDRSVVAVAGKVTARRVGSAMSEIGLSVLAEGNAAQDRLNYLTKAPDGRVINSSTIVLRDRNAAVFGALCINSDVTALRNAVTMLEALIGAKTQPRPTTFTDDIRDVIEAVLRDELGGRSPQALSRRDRLEIIRALHSRGVFSIKRAMQLVAASLGVSRATAYACLHAVRTESAAGARAGDTPVSADGRSRIAGLSR